MKPFVRFVSGQFAFIFMVLFSFQTLADGQKPPAFVVGENKFVFISIDSAVYRITLNPASQSATVESEILFHTEEDGFPIFDLVPQLNAVSIDGVQAAAPEIPSPDGTTTFRYVTSSVKAGAHQLKLVHILNSQNTQNSFRMKDGDVSFGFWVSDLTDRKYIERFVPTNMDFDQYPMQIEAVTPEGYEVFTNGSVTLEEVEQAQTFTVNFPAYFTCSMPFFHIEKRGAMKVSLSTFKSMDGRNIPVTYYTADQTDWTDKIHSKLQKLESELGPWPHPNAVVFGVSNAGMEYAGATWTRLDALEHELFHSYFARGMISNGGASGWIDEALASWHDKGYPEVEQPLSSVTPLHALNLPYIRITNRAAYREGASFMGYLNFLLRAQGGLRENLKKMIPKILFKPLRTQDFQAVLSETTQRNFSAEFNKYVYNGASLATSERLQSRRSDKSLNSIEIDEKAAGPFGQLK